MKCNTKSSTKTELISFADKLTDIIWMHYFLECLGYEISVYVVFQDTMSALLLEKKGRVLSSIRTKHINAKYFLIKNHYDAREIDVRFFPMDMMWADIYSLNLCKDRSSEICMLFYQPVHKTMTTTQKSNIHVLMNIQPDKPYWRVNHNHPVPRVCLKLQGGETKWSFSQ